MEKLALVSYRSKRALAADDEGAIIANEDLIAMALVVRTKSARSEVMYVPDWRSESMVLFDVKMLRQLVRITPMMDTTYNELVQVDETCLDEDLDIVLEGPELQEEHQCLQILVDKFMGHVRAIIGNTHLSIHVFMSCIIDVFFKLT
jgi:hypothetical protein